MSPESSALRNVPDRRAPGALLEGLRELGIRLDAGAHRIPRRPAARRIFEYADVVERALTGIERRIGPQRSQLDRALVLADRTRAQVDRRTVVGAAMSLVVRDESVGA